MSLTYCSKCKTNRSSDLFTHPSRPAPYKTCSNCRSRERSRYRRPLFQAQPLSELSRPNNDVRNGVDNIEVDTEGLPHIAEDSIMNDNPSISLPQLENRVYHSHVEAQNLIRIEEEAEGQSRLKVLTDFFAHSTDALEITDSLLMRDRQAETDDEPILILSHRDTQEYVTHMQAREALPDDHDNIFESEFAAQLERAIQNTHNPNNGAQLLNDDNIDNQRNEVIIEGATTGIDEHVSSEQPIIETTLSRRLPNWLSPLPANRPIPAAYVSKYNRNMPAHYLGTCTSVCPSCHALHWIQERVKTSSVTHPRFQTCCKEGQVILNEIPEAPAYLQYLWTSHDRLAKSFRSNSRSYNRAFAFTSFNYTADRRLAENGIRGGIRSFSIHGQVYHQTGAALREGALPRYAQIYFIDPERAVDVRTEQNNLDSNIVREITFLMERTNPFVEYYHTALRSLQESEREGSLRVVLNPEFRLVLEAHTDRRRYNLPTASEVAVVIPDEVDRNRRDVILFARNSDGMLSERFEYIPRNHPAYLPLHYVLFYPHGNPGYQWSIPLQNQRVRGNFDQSEEAQEGARRSCVSARQFYRYHLFSRQDPETLLTKFNALIHGEKLFQQLCCDMYACVDDNVLNWHRQNQATIRSDLYSGVIDALRTDTGTQIGAPVILASSYIGGDRHMTKCFQNAMAISRAIGTPSLFLTFTANPSWPEILENLHHNQSPDSRPDLIAIVFKLKLDQYLYDIKERNVCGVTIGSQYSIEYQKRGLPHAHLLLTLHQDCVPRCPEQVDELVRAQVPRDDPALAAIVKSQLTHGPCGSEFPNAPCMMNGKCSKGYPKRWCEETIIRENSYPEYARPNNGVRWGTERFMFDNRWVVPYNPFLTKKYGAHINVEVACGVRAIKYLAKYIYKGSDRATLAVPGQYDEIDMTLQGRYIGPVQAIWRLLSYTTHEEKPAVMQLPFHLEGRHRVAFSRVMTREQIAAAVETQSSAFIDWMNYNAANTDGRDLLYIDFPMHYTYIKNRNRGWHMRKKGHTIGRLPVAVPRQGEHFYLRTLLTAKHGARSYEDLYTVDGVNFETPSATCRALNLIHDDSEWIIMFDEVKDTNSAASLRYQFGAILANAGALDPQGIWNRFKDPFSDDCLFRISSLEGALSMPPLEWSEEERRYDYALWLFGDVLQDLGLDWEVARLIKYRHNWELREQNVQIAEALDFDQEAERENFSDSLHVFSSGQRAAYDTIMHTIDNDLRPNTFFLQGPAGTGKTFLYKTLCSKFRSEGKIALCVASCGIAALLLPNGRTAHSLFKIPVKCTEDSICRIPAQSQLANLLRQTSLIIWDEVTMQLKFNFSAVDRVLRDLCDGSALFGGIPVLFGGDFAQILPVVKNGRREQVVNASIKSWPGWCSVKPLFLTQNMRVISGPDNQRFADWLSALPYTPSMYGSIDIPEWIRTTDDRTLFREFVYPIRDLQSLETSIFHDRAILSSRNDATHRFNDEIAVLRGTLSRDYFSLDEVRNEEGVICGYTPEYLRQVTCQGLPAGILRLQVGMPVMLLRNYYPKLGLCNGTRLIITRLYSRCVKARIVSQDPRFHGKEHLISRFTLNSEDELPFPMVRRQLPLRPCFAMTINKSQGQTLKVVGVDLSTPVFTHGQFYVALSRVTDVKNLIILLPHRARGSTNVVYPEALLTP